MIYLSNARSGSRMGHKPSPLVAEGREGGIAPAGLSAPGWPYAEGGIPPSPTLPHKGGEDRSRQRQGARP